MATFDHEEWENANVIAVIFCLIQTSTHRVHIIHFFVAFLQGALETWVRFTSEFKETGLIATASQAERDLAFMPCTNDANEGTLGMWRKFTHKKNGLTEFHFTEQSMFHRNDTQAFMDQHFSTEDYQFLIWQAREIDASGQEKKQCEIHRNHLKELAATHQRKLAEHLAKQAKREVELAGIDLVTDCDVIDKMICKALNDQLDLWRKLDDEVPIKSKVPWHALKIEAVLEALGRLSLRWKGVK